MSERRLRPARYEPEETGAFRPRFPWGKVLLVVGLLGGGLGYHFYREHRRAEALRRAIAEAYARQVEPARAMLRTFRHRIDGWIQQAAAAHPTRWADPRLDLQGLHGANGVYVRIPASEAADPKRIAAAVEGSTPDAIARCLGLAPLSIRPLYARGRFLQDAWLQDVARTQGVMRLRVLDEDLRRFARRDLPILLELARSDYFMLVLERGPNRKDGPVDVFLWDLKRGEPLLVVRAKAETGLLLPVHLAGAPRTPRPSPRIGGQVDCSIAAQVRAAAGQQAPAIGAEAATRLAQQHAPAAPPASQRTDGGPSAPGPAAAPAGRSNDPGPRKAE